jgi:maleate isomerase
MAAPIRLGMLTPSSNTCLEPVTIDVLRSLEQRVSVHFTRVAVRRIGLDEDGVAQFDYESMIAGARLLAEAEPTMIAWNGTSGSWLGVEHDRELCRLIETETHVPATTSTLALLDALSAEGVRRYGLAVPYTEDVADQIVTTYAGHGLDCVGSQYLGLSRNFDFDLVESDRLQRLVQDAAAGADGVAAVCTNLRVGPLVETLESDLGLPIIDSVVATIWKMLDVALDGVQLERHGDLAMNGSLRARLGAILEELLRATRSSRTTIRLDLPRRNLGVDLVTAEAVADGVRSIRHDRSLDQWAMPTVQFIATRKRTLVQNDFESGDPPVADALMSVYGVQAQMLSPLARDGRVYGWISVHQTERPREWSATDVAAIEDACVRAQAAIDSQLSQSR